MTIFGAASYIREKIGGETSIVVFTMVVQTCLRIGGSMIMTRLLTSADFGVIGFITSVMVVVGMISDVGIGAFIVRHRSSDDVNYVNELWTLKLIRSLSLMLVVLIFSGPISSYLGRSDLQWAIIITSLSFVVDGLDSLGTLLAVRSRQIRRLSQLDILMQCVNLMLTLSLSYWLRSYWGIIIGNLLGQIIRMGLSYYAFPTVRHRWRFSKARARELWRFSKFITGSTMLTLLILQTDKLVLVKIFPLDVFGLYILAGGLAGVPINVAHSYGGRILLPRYGDIVRNAPKRLPRAYYQERLVAHLSYAAGVGLLAGTCPVIIKLLYDPRYYDAAIYFRILLLGAFFTFGNIAANEAMIALGRSYFTLTTNLVRVCTLTLGGYIGFLYFGPLGLVWTVSAMEVSAQIYGWYTLRKLDLFDGKKEAMIILVGSLAFVIGCALNETTLFLSTQIGLKI